ncbi:AraC family transcriptional regulator [Oscillatoria sp. CS-180]|uniref:helix-turn-helix transcriptional regulator n=1 Tax=Oscillatoria sp. CS-180 TaxID=3021720 RepID=UPI00233098D5|nr:AraC family transcriptional regulator [Oscillatoria sp. CS-180]MDB9527169.1 AraC family transcriptional regulator [Oscillatoria sp. CS-180]
MRIVSTISSSFWIRRAPKTTFARFWASSLAQAAPIPLLAPVIAQLAERANMSVSSFHRHFKTVTSMSPLQYQKHLRLVEARRLMLTEDADATHAAYQVGYESPSQFSREYSRMFGSPPIQDVQRLRTA